ncbi:MAG TPA: zf-HC2 domain-containing protein [Anaerolineaceae bacterium]
MNEIEEIHEQHDTCKSLLSSLSEYVDGSLSDELCSVLEQHMKGCQRCRIVVDTLRKTVELYHETSDELPDTVRERLFLKLNLEEYLK